MINKHLTRINSDGIANLLSEFADAQLEREFTKEEFNGVMKFIVYLIKRWGKEVYREN